MPSTFDLLAPATTTGTYTTPELDISAVGRILTATMGASYDAPSGCSVSFETRVKLDSTAWTAWAATTPFGAIPGLSRGTAFTTALVQVKATLVAAYLVTPILHAINVDIAPNYKVTEHLSSEEDVTDYWLATNSTVTYTTTLNNGTVDIAVRGKATSDGVFSDWVAQTSGAVPAVNLPILQYKATIMPTITETNDTPVLTSVVATYKPQGKRGVWTSESVDVSNASDRASGKVALDFSVAGGQVNVFSRSAASSGGTYSSWNIALADGSLTHPTNDYVQVMLVILGDTTVVNDVTLVFDGEPVVTTLLSGMTSGAEYDFTTLDDLLMIVNGNDTMRSWDGTTVNTMAASVPLFKMLETHQNRCWGVSVETASRVYFSNILDPTTWGEYDFIDFNPDDGDYITSICRYGQNLVVSKQQSMALLTGDRSSNYSVSWLDSEQGATGVRAMTVADKYLCYMAQDGIRFSDLSQSVVATERLADDWERVNKKRLNQASMVYWRNYLYVALPVNGSLMNNEVWCYDFLRNAWTIFEGWEVSYWLKFKQYGEDVLYAGSSNIGQVYQVDTTYYDDSTPVAYEWQSKDFNFRTPERYKLFRNIFLDIIGVTEENTLNIDLIVDGITVGTYTTVIPAGKDNKYTRRILPPLYGAVLGSRLSLKVRGRCGVQSITIEYAVRGNIPGEDV